MTSLPPDQAERKKRAFTSDSLNTKFAFLAAVVLLIGGGLSIQIAAKSLGVYLKKEPVRA